MAQVQQAFFVPKGKMLIPLKVRLLLVDKVPLTLLMTSSLLKQPQKACQR